MKRNYKTIDGLAKVSEQITIENILHCSVYNKKAGWVTINNLMTEELAENIADLLGGINKTKQAVKRTLLHHGKNLNHWGLSRIIYNPRLKRFTYCAGQDYQAEINAIRNYLK